MEKLFWQELIQNEYDIPDEYTIYELTKELFSYRGSTDPELRDDIGYRIYANWLKMGLYSQDIILKHISQVPQNLAEGIGGRDTDSVFMRSFSALFLAEIIHNDNKSSRLNKSTIATLVEKALWYLEQEKEARGYVQFKGWAHALAHTADLLLVLANHKYTDGIQLLRTLNGITTKLASVDAHIYIHGEDDRLSAAALAILNVAC